MLAYLKTQIFDIRSTKFCLQEDLSKTKNENNCLRKKCSSLSISVVSLKHHGTQLSKVNMNLAVEVNKMKKELASLKKGTSINELMHASEVKKIKDLMNSKDDDNAQYIAKLEAEIVNIRGSTNQNSCPVLKIDLKKQRNNYEKGRKTEKSNKDNAIYVSSKSKIDAEEQWGHNSYYSMHGSSITKGKFGGKGSRSESLKLFQVLSSKSAKKGKLKSPPKYPSKFIPRSRRRHL